jgi:hypothetical protein
MRPPIPGSSGRSGSSKLARPGAAASDVAPVNEGVAAGSVPAVGRRLHRWGVPVGVGESTSPVPQDGRSACAVAGGTGAARPAPSAGPGRRRPGRPTPGTGVTGAARSGTRRPARRWLGRPGISTGRARGRCRPPHQLRDPPSPRWAPASAQASRHLDATHRIGSAIPIGLMPDAHHTALSVPGPPASGQARRHPDATPASAPRSQPTGRRRPRHQRRLRSPHSSG